MADAWRIYREATYAVEAEWRTIRDKAWHDYLEATEPARARYEAARAAAKQAYEKAKGEVQ